MSSFIPRSSFPLPSRSPSYFLGHMARSLRDMPALLQDIDLVIEARDARLPLSGVNSGFEGVIKRAWGEIAGVGSAPGPRTGMRAGAGAGMAGAMPLSRPYQRLALGSRSPSGISVDSGRYGAGAGHPGRVRERVVVYTKRDLAEERFEEPIRRALLEQANQKVFFANTSADRDVKHILHYAVRLAKDHAAVMNEMKILVVGMPNVGKSSLLNAFRRVGMRKGKAFRTSSQPGYTRKLTGTVRIHSEPDIYVYDTPGVMVPYMGKGEKGVERALKFALTTGIKAGLVEEEVVADYLLYLLNQHYYDRFSASSSSSSTAVTYLTALGLPEQPTNSLHELLETLAKRLGALKKGGELDTEAAMVFFLRLYREGKLGRLTLDDMTGRRTETETGGLLGQLLVAERTDGIETESTAGGESDADFGDHTSRRINDTVAYGSPAAGSPQPESIQSLPMVHAPDALNTKGPTDRVSGEDRDRAPVRGSASGLETPSASSSTPALGNSSASEAADQRVLDWQDPAAPFRPDAGSATPLPSSDFDSFPREGVDQHSQSVNVDDDAREGVDQHSQSVNVDDDVDADADADADIDTVISAPSFPDSHQPDPNLYAQVAATVRTFLADQARRLTQTEEMSQSQQRKREMQQKKKERAEKWAKKNPGAAAGLGYGSDRNAVGKTAPGSGSRR